MLDSLKTKKVIFLLLITTFFSIQSFGQNILEGYWGVKGGLNLNKISQIEFDNTFKPGFHLGVFANFQISDKFSIQHEVLYSMRGVSLDLPSGKGKYSQTFSFLDLPWMLNFHATKNFIISGGVQPSVYAYFRRPKADTIVYNKDNISTIDCGYLVGASILMDNNIGFGIRFTGSLFPAFDLSNYTGKSYVAQVFLSYAINKRKGMVRRRR